VPLEQPHVLRHHHYHHQHVLHVPYNHAHLLHRSSSSWLRGISSLLTGTMAVLLGSTRSWLVPSVQPVLFRACRQPIATAHAAGCMRERVQGGGFHNRRHSIASLLLCIMQQQQLAEHQQLQQHAQLASAQRAAGLVQGLQAHDGKNT
jgi:hypothetical protein